MGSPSAYRYRLLLFARPSGSSARKPTRSDAIPQLKVEELRCDVELRNGSGSVQLLAEQSKAPTRVFGKLGF
jgi:hypothetical protein